VVMADHNPQTLEAATAELGERAVPVVCDLRRIDDCKRLIATAEERCGRVDVVVNNAYKGYYQSLEQLTDEAWQEELAIGLTAMMATCRAALPGMLARGRGAIVNTGSRNSYTPAYGMAAYATVKAGILNFTRQIAVQYGPQGIRANSICPGFITHAKREAHFDAHPLERKRIEATIPLRRVGHDGEIAEASLFLASDSSSFVTGASLVVDGGATVQNPKMVTWPMQEALAEEWGREG